MFFSFASLCRRVSKACWLGTCWLQDIHTDTDEILQGGLREHLISVMRSWKWNTNGRERPTFLSVVGRKPKWTYRGHTGCWCAPRAPRRASTSPRAQWWSATASSEAQPNRRRVECRQLSDGVLPRKMPCRHLSGHYRYWEQACLCAAKQPPAAGDTKQHHRQNFT